MQYAVKSGMVNPLISLIIICFYGICFVILHIYKR